MTRLATRTLDGGMLGFAVRGDAGTQNRFVAAPELGGGIRDSRWGWSTRTPTRAGAALTLGPR